MKIGRRVMMSLYLDPPQKVALAKLAEHTRVPVSVYLREAVDDLLRKHARELKDKKRRR